MQSRAVIFALRNLSSGQTRASKSAHETTAYWGKDSRGGKASRHKLLKAYLKHFEVESQLKELLKVVDTTDEGSWQRRQVAALQSDTVQQFAKNNVRFEASIMPAMLNRLGFPLRVGDFVHHCESMKKTTFCPIQFLWHESWKDIFKTFEGKQVNIYNDDEVRDVLRREYATVTPTGKLSFAKADRLFRFVRSLKSEGWEEVKHTTPEPTFYRNVGLVTKVIPKAFLVNLQNSAASNVVPLIRLINVDFTKQLPVGWVEPRPLTEQRRLRAVG
jgi:II/X family phage/plasmid replication protein